MLPWILVGWLWLQANIYSVAAQTCSASSPCAVGCCSKFGNCGFGPDFCGDDCIGQCSRKSECDPGFGSKWAKSSSCPLNVCCSKFGFCGTTKDFCGNKKVSRKVCSKQNGNARVIGYYEGWAHERPCNVVWPEQIPAGVYTHINFAFATIDPVTFKVGPTSRYDLNLYQRITSLKNDDPGLKVFIAIGGWAFNDPGPTATTFSDISASFSRQMKFIVSLISFLDTYGFDGVDLDWEYPGADDRSGRPIDFKSFPIFMRRLKSALKLVGKEVSITLPASYWYLQHFDVKNLIKHVDWFNIMSYDLHGTWDKGNQWTGNYLNAHTNLTEIDAALDLLWRNDIDPSKVVLGLAFYSRSFAASSTSCLRPGCTFETGGTPGRCSRTEGVLLNSEIDEYVKIHGIKPTLIQDAAVKIATWDNQWVAYDDVETFKLKSEFAQGRCLGGLMVWAISHDTSDSKYSLALAEATNRRSSLLSFVRKNRYEGPYASVLNKHDQCKWTNCGQSCPSGWFSVPRQGKDARRNEQMTDETGCGRGGGVRTFCCPPGKIPFCGWYNYHNGGCRGGSCPSDMKEIGSTTKYCRRSYQVACCSTKDVDSMGIYETYEWSTDADCDSLNCPNKEGDKLKVTALAVSRTGSGGSSCPDPDANRSRRLCANARDQNNRFYDCSLYDSRRGGCPDDKFGVALDTSFRYGGLERDKVTCCRVSRQDVVETLDPRSENRRDALLDWLKNPTCPNPGSMISSGHKTIEPRGNRDSAYVVQGLLAALLLRTYSERELEKATEDWNQAMSGSFPHLTMPEFGETVKKHPSYDRDGPYQMAHNVVCHPDFWNARSGGTKTIDCSECDGDVCFQSTKRSIMDSMMFNSSNSPLDAESAAQAPDYPSLTRRSSPRDYRVRMVSPTGETFTMTITLPGYYSASELDETNPIFDHAIDFDDSGDCANAALGTLRIYNGRYYQVEHTIEGQQMRQFFQDAAAGRLASGATATNGAVSVSFFRTANRRTRMGPSPPPLPGGADYDRLIDRVMECLGSHTNTASFSFLHALINYVKGKLVENTDPLARSRWREMSTDEARPEDFLLQIRRILSAINYLDFGATPNINSYLATVANNVRAQLLYAQQQWNAQHPNDQVHIAEFWSEWIKDYYRSWLVPRARDLAQDMITEMRHQWGVSTSDLASRVLRILDLLESQTRTLAIDTSGIR